MDERSLRIKKLIEESGLSYQELAKRTGVPKSSLQRYASGTTSKIPLDAVEKITAGLGVDPRYIMCWEEVEKNNKAAVGLAENLRTDSYFLSVVEKLDKLDRDKLAAVDQMLSALL